MMRAHGKRKKHAKTTDFRLIDEAAERRTRRRQFAAAGAVLVISVLAGTALLRAVSAPADPAAPVLTAQQPDGYVLGERSWASGPVPAVTGGGSEAGVEMAGGAPVAFGGTGLPFSPEEQRRLELLREAAERWAGIEIARQ